MSKAFAPIVVDKDLDKLENEHEITEEKLHTQVKTENQMKKETLVKEQRAQPIPTNLTASKLTDQY